MYYRRKLILSLISSFGGSLDKIAFQKLLFIVCKSQSKPEYHFIPCKFGCYSYQASADIRALITYGNVTEVNNCWVLNDKTNYNALIDQPDKLLLMRVKQQFASSFTNDTLIQYTYTKFPYYAINSTLAEGILTKDEYQKIIDCKPKSNFKALYTIGYEGISLEEYINKLIKYDIKVLCDVRSNAFSQKFGFSKKQLELACTDTGITYKHIPEVGIKSDKRQNLETQSQYDSLFKIYNKEVIPSTIEYQENIVSLIAKYERVAITCFESNIHQCHRKHLAEAIVKLPSWHYELKHI